MEKRGDIVIKIQFPIITQESTYLLMWGTVWPLIWEK